MGERSAAGAEHYFSTAHSSEEIFILRKFSILALGVALALSFSACSSQHSVLPDVAAHAVPAGGKSPQLVPGSGMHPDDPCAGGSDTICVVGGGGSGNLGSTFGGGGGGGYGGGVLCPQLVKGGGGRHRMCSAGGSGSTGTGKCFTDSFDCPTQVAINNGPPTQGSPCPSNDGANSLPVGATVGYANTGNGQVARSVKDINAIYGFSGVKIINGHTYYTNLVTLGWVYEDNGGAFWFQQNPNISWTYSLGIGVTAGSVISASFAVNSPPGQKAVSIGSTPGNLQQHESASPCFTDGATFFPNEVTG